LQALGVQAITSGEESLVLLDELAETGIGIPHSSYRNAQCNGEQHKDNGHAQCHLVSQLHLTPQKIVLKIRRSKAPLQIFIVGNDRFFRAREKNLVNCLFGTTWFTGTLQARDHRPSAPASL
jgi:hypothetical protein